MTNTKITKAQKFTMLKAIPAVQENPLLMEFIDHELELLAKKNSGDKKPTAAQVVNDGIKQVILSILEQSDKPMTITEIQKSDAEISELSNQRITSLVSQLVKAEKVLRTTEKGKAYFAIAE